MIFNPVNITITAGQTVTWVWMGNNHSTTSDTGIWDSGLHDAPHMFQHTFNTAGSFPYYCTLHGLPGGIGMHGTVTVNP
jgi:plastocyanin